MACLFISLSIIQNRSHQKIIKCIVKIAFFMALGCQNPNENRFHGFGNLVIWLSKRYGNIPKGVCTNPDKTTRRVGELDLKLDLYTCISMN